MLSFALPRDSQVYTHTELSQLFSSVEEIAEKYDLLFLIDEWRSGEKMRKGENERVRK
jgi:hypothetical protein